MKNGSGPTHMVEASQEETLSSGVKVTILPFPARLHDTIQNKANSMFPEPVPPKKIVNVLGGVEETDDVNDPTYKEQLELCRVNRERWVGTQISEKILLFCIKVDLKPYEALIEKLAKSLDDEVPSDPDEKLRYFLINIALRGRADYERITSVALELMAVSDKEIEARMDNFRSEMARGTAQSN